jgi:hypothetical protein
MSTAIDVHLEYCRDGDLSTGCIYLRDARGGVAERSEFTRIAFEDMLLRAARLLDSAATPGEPGARARVVLRRTDRAGLLPYVLDAATVDLLRHDPLAAIASMTYRTTAPLVSPLAREVPPPGAPVLKAGTDVLADAFGDDIWVRVRGAELECPGCGLWGTFASPALAESRREVLKVVFACSKRCSVRVVAACHARWASVRVDELLLTAAARFYLPRAWNTDGPWITRQALSKTYQDYLTEKEQAECSTTTVS